ncbi:Epsin-1 [Ranunculus cassubicifolius]
MVAKDPDNSEEALLLSFPSTTSPFLPPYPQIPKDTLHLAYLTFFTLGTGFLLPWNAFITAVDYFSYLYPSSSVDRVFAVVYMVIALICVAIIVIYAHRSINSVRINVGLVMFMVAMLVVPVMDVVYVKGKVGLFSGFYFTVAAVGICGVADALVQGGVVGAAGELPERYMQAVVAGTAASGVLVSFLRIITKSVYSQDAEGLRKSANLYFAVSIVFMAICIVSYNLVDRLPVIKYYKELKLQAETEHKSEKGLLTGSAWRSTLWDILGKVKWFGVGLLLVYTVTLSIFPGYITEDVQSPTLKDWYPIILITCYNVFDLVGKCLTAVYLFENMNVAVGACVGRLVFYPLFVGCLHGPMFFRTEIPVVILTSLLGLTNGYLTSVLMILAPKAVQIQHSETAGIVMVLFLVVGLAVGSVVSWFWVI